MKWLTIALIAACGPLDSPAEPAPPPTPAVGYRPEQRSAARTDEQCLESPPTVPGKFRHRRNRAYAAIGEARHRGIDLIAGADDPTQLLRGKLAYSVADKDVADEVVELHACVARRWVALGQATTSDDGRFSLELGGDRRLPVGMRDVLAYVPGDGSEIRFLAYVATRDEQVVVTDIDGTLTDSEYAILGEVFGDRKVAPRLNASAALQRSGRPIIYVSARGDQLTEPTRRWLREHGFPRGPLRLAPQLLVPPGRAQLEVKTRLLAALGVPIAAGIGNRATDIASYRGVGVRPDRILVYLSELASEVRDEVAAGRARGFSDYRDLPPLLP